MSQEKNEFIPEITINNTGEKKTIEVDGVEQEVEIPAKKGFNIKTRSLSGEYKKEFFLEDFSGQILFDRYQIQSKYSTKPMFMSNEFEFSGKRNHLRVYCPEHKEVIYEGDYDGAKEHFATGQTTSAGTPEKSFDIFSILYVLKDGEVFRFRWKLNQNNTWFKYKSGCRNEDSDFKNNTDYRGCLTEFNLEKKKFGTNEFWSCNLLNKGIEPRDEADKVAAELEEKLDSNNYDKKEQKTESKEDEVSVENIPF